MEGDRRLRRLKRRPPPSALRAATSPSRGGSGRHGPQKQNGSRCCHRPPLVPGPNCRAGEGLASFQGGLNSMGASSLGVRVPAEVLRPRSVPNEHLSGEPAGYSFAVPSAEASGSADLRRKWDRLAPHASSSKVFHRFRGLQPRRVTARFRGGRVSELSSPRGSPLFLAKGHNDRASRFAPAESGPFCLWITRITWISRRIRRPTQFPV